MAIFQQFQKNKTRITEEISFQFDRFTQVFGGKVEKSLQPLSERIHSTKLHRLRSVTGFNQKNN
jgi:hypothetical protein